MSQFVAPVTYEVEVVTGPMARLPGDAVSPHPFDVDTRTEDFGPSRRIAALGDAEPPAEWSDLVVVQSLAVGGQGSLWLAQTPDLTQVVLRRSVLPHAGNRGHRINREQLRGLSHPNIVERRRDPVDRPPFRWECLEFCEAGSLAHIQRERSGGYPHPLQPLDYETIRSVVAGISAALEYLHTQAQLLHTDVKPDNILQRSDGTFVLADFGSAVNSLEPPPVGDSSARTHWYSPKDDFFSPAWDWAQLGLTVFALATGERNALQGIGECNFGLLDQRISLLIRGLMIPEIGSDPTDYGNCRRWGYDEIERWLRGETPMLAGSDIAMATRREGMFRVSFSGRVRNSPEEFGRALGGPNWASALRLVQGRAEGNDYLKWLAEQLDECGDPRADEVRRLGDLRVIAYSESLSAGTVYPDSLLAQLITCLDPLGTPSYGMDEGIFTEFTPSAIADLCRRAAEELDSGEGVETSGALLDRIWDRHMLREFARASQFEWLQMVDFAWHRAEFELREVLRVAAEQVAGARSQYQGELARRRRDSDQLFEFQTSEWEEFAAKGKSEFGRRTRAALLVALLNPEYQQQLLDHAQGLLDSPAGQQKWFSEIATGRARAREDLSYPTGHLRVIDTAPGRVRRGLDRWRGVVSRRWSELRARWRRSV